jgi:hypothetical protein
MANMRLRSGATMPIIEPGWGIKNRMLSKTLGGMTGTGLGTRSAAQPGLFAQLAPLFIAAGIKDPKEIKKLMDMFSGGKPTPALPSSTGGEVSPGSGDMDAIDWGSVADSDWLSNFSADDLASTGGDWGWLD